MARSKTVFGWIKRPLLFALIVLMPFLILQNIKLSKDKPLPVKSGENISYKARVLSKTYDEEGKLKTFIAGKALCRCSDYEGKEPKIGSLVLVTGKLSEFDRPFNRGGFDSRAYYRARGMDFAIKVKSAEDIEYGKWPVKEWLCGLRKNMTASVRRYCPRESGTINTLLLADKSGLSPERKDLYKSVSLAHFLVVSGLHVSAFAGAVFRVSKFVFRRKTPSCIVTIILLILYGMLIDFGVSVVRAIIMYVVRLFASIIGESYDMLSAASLAAILTLSVNPLNLTDSAFIYSYTAVFGIGFLFESNIITGLKGIKDKLKDTLRFSFAMCLIMLPVTLKFSGAYTLGAVLMNLFIVPFGPLLLGDGFLALMSSVMGLSLPASAFDHIEYILLKITDSVALFMVRFSALRLSGEPTLPAIFAYYGFLLIYVFKLRKIAGRYSRILIPITLMQAVSTIWWWRPTVSMLYVGQGECVVVRTGPRTAFISDCGSTSKEKIWDYDLEPFLNASGINRIEGFFVSHSDNDHTSGLSEYLEAYRRSGIGTDKIVLQKLLSEDMKLTEIKKAAKRNNIAVYELAAGDRVTFGDWRLKVLWPSRKSSLGDVNSDSLVFLAEYGDFSMLFTGDISTETEKKVTELADNGLTGTVKIRADILKVPHHGSKSASSETFLRTVDPKAALISAGIRNSYHHPSPVVTDRLESMGIPYFCTIKYGEIDVQIRQNSTKFWVEGYRK